MGSTPAGCRLLFGRSVFDHIGGDGAEGFLAGAGDPDGNEDRDGEFERVYRPCPWPLV